MMSQAVFATGTGAELDADGDGEADIEAQGVDVTDVLGAGVVVALSDVLGVADVLGADVPDGLAAGVLAAGVLGAGVTVADRVGNGRWRRPETTAADGDTADDDAADDDAAAVDVAGATDVLADPLSEGVAQVVARLTALPADFNEVPECAVISIPPTTPRTATTMPTITPR
jgi:hypothetical protein